MTVRAYLLLPACVALLFGCPTSGGDDDDAADDHPCGTMPVALTMAPTATEGFDQAVVCWDAVNGTCSTASGTDWCEGAVTFLFRYRSDLTDVIDHPAYLVPEAPWVLDSGSPGTVVNGGQEYSELAEWPDGSEVTASLSNPDTGDTLTVEFTNDGQDISLTGLAP
jgi:hypothetical protein